VGALLYLDGELDHTFTAWPSTATDRGNPIRAQSYNRVLSQQPRSIELGISASAACPILQLTMLERLPQNTPQIGDHTILHAMCDSIVGHHMRVTRHSWKPVSASFGVCCSFSNTSTVAGNGLVGERRDRAAYRSPEPRRDLTT